MFLFYSGDVGKGDDEVKWFKLLDILRLGLEQLSIAVRLHRLAEEIEWAFGLATEGPHAAAAFLPVAAQLLNLLF